MEQLLHIVLYQLLLINFQMQSHAMFFFGAVKVTWLKNI